MSQKPKATRPAVRDMTVGVLLDILEENVARHRSDCIASVLRNRRSNELNDADAERLRVDAEHYQRVVDAVLVDFINEVARSYGGNRGERTEHIKPST
jgi:hypothetical protein